MLLALPAGTALDMVRFDGIGAGTAGGWRDTVWFGVLAPYQDPASLRITEQGSLARWVVGDTIAPILWDAPEGLIVDGQISPLGALATQHIVADSVGFWVKYGVRDVLERRERDGTTTGEWSIPRTARRGYPVKQLSRSGVALPMDVLGTGLHLGDVQSRSNAGEGSFRRTGTGDVR